MLFISGVYVWLDIIRICMLTHCQLGFCTAATKTTCVFSDRIRSLWDLRIWRLVENRLIHVLKTWYCIILRPWGLKTRKKKLKFLGCLRTVHLSWIFSFIFSCKGNHFTRPKFIASISSKTIGNLLLVFALPQKQQSHNFSMLLFLSIAWRMHDVEPAEPKPRQNKFVCFRFRSCGLAT